MNNKFFRYILGFLLLGLIISAFCLNKYFLCIVSIFFIIIAMIEYRNMFKSINVYPHKFLPEVTGSICAVVFSLNNIPSEQFIIMPVIVFSFILSFILTVILNKKPYIMTSFSTIAAVFFIICGLYIMKLTYYFEEKFSIFLILIYFTAVLAGDFSASKIGPKFKKYLLSPEISPNKTAAGALANLFFTCLICLLLKLYLDFRIIECIMLGLVISIFAQFGDLTISTIKRNLGIKDSGNFFYEYGGILDRMDAFIFSAPAAYYLLFIFM